MRRDIHPHVADRSLWAGDRKRGHLRAGLHSSTALTDPRFLRYKGGGGFMGIFKSVAIGAVLGAITGGAGFGLGFTTGASVFGLSAGLSSAIASGAAMGALGGLLSGAAGAIMGGPKAAGQQQFTYEAHDNKLTVRNSTAPRKKIYGTAFAAGTLIYATSTGGSHDYIDKMGERITTLTASVSALSEGVDGVKTMLGGISETVNMLMTHELAEGRQAKKRGLQG